MRLLEDTKIRRCITVLLSIQLILFIAMVSFVSSASYTENAAKWGSEQTLWVVLSATLVIAAGAWMEHTLSTAIVTVTTGNILAYLYKQPEVISTIENAVDSRVSRRRLWITVSREK